MPLAHVSLCLIRTGVCVQLMVDIDDLTDRANLLVILFAIITPFTVAFRYIMKAKNKYYLYKARHADTVVQHTHSTNRGAPPPPLNTPKPLLHHPVAAGVRG